MKELNPHSPETRETLRAYLLDTLSEADRAGVEQQLESSPLLREILEEERGKLDQLGVSPDRSPSQDLSAAVMRRVRNQNRPEDKRVLVFKWTASIAATLIVVMMAGAFFMPALSRSREAARRASSQNNLKQMGVVFKMYANDSGNGMYPPLTRYEGYWVPDMERLYPNYLNDLNILVDPGHPEAGEIAEQLEEAVSSEPIDWQQVTRLVAKSYTYTGYALRSEEDLERMEMARLAGQAAQDSASRDTAAMPLRDGIERYLITDINNPGATTDLASTIPVMFETVYSGDRRPVPLGANVLYLDGHVEFVRYGEKFPVTEAVSEALRPPQE